MPTKPTATHCFCEPTLIPTAQSVVRCAAAPCLNGLLHIHGSDLGPHSGCVHQSVIWTLASCLPVYCICCHQNTALELLSIQ